MDLPAFFEAVKYLLKEHNFEKSKLLFLAYFMCVVKDR